MRARTRLGMGLVLLLSTGIVAILAPEGWALIMGGEGNAPQHDPGWPKGAAAVFNVPARIAWWEGPPFGGGQWHGEYRGDAKALSAVLADFAKLDVKTKRLILHDGVGHSFWLNPNNEATKRAAARMDWSFSVWQPDSWEHLRKLPADLNPIDPEEAKVGPPAQLDVYTGGDLKWADVTVPKGLQVEDQRLEAHGFTVADGVVLEGKVTDLDNQKPVAAQVRLELIEPQAKGGYHYAPGPKTTADAEGHWVLKKVPAGWYQLVIEADGFLPRVIGYLKPDDQPQWYHYDGGLARPATVAGRVLDEAGQPLTEVEVQFADLTASDGGRYRLPQDAKVKTGADGRFSSDQVPLGRATVWLSKPGYVRPGLGQSIATPKKDVELTMTKAGRVVVTVDFTGKKRPEAYLVEMEPVGGAVVGTYGGSGQINAQDQMTFDPVPPGRYIVRGQPNPSSPDQKTEPVTVEVKGGKKVEVKVVAK